MGACSAQKAARSRAADLWGRQVVRTYQVAEVEPHQRLRGCSGVLKLDTPGGTRWVCNLSRDFLESLSPGDTVIVGGYETWFGQTMKRFAKRE